MIKKSLVKFGYLVATLNLLFLLDLKSNDTSSKDNVVTNLETTSNNGSTEGKDIVSEEPLKDNEVAKNTSD